tara:strand:- start:9230 stop:9748 length:519 start_codon:yes stop_codon:yes gene_type:complete
MASLQLVETTIKQYKPLFDEKTGLYTDVCPYIKYDRNKSKITYYSCPCKSGTIIQHRPQFLQHIKSKVHKNWKENIGNDENVQIIKDLRIKNGKLENQLLRNGTRIKLIGKQLQTEIKNNETIMNEFNKYKLTYECSINIKEQYIQELRNTINELQENIVLLEQSPDSYVET